MSDDEAGAVDAASVEVDIVDVSKLRLPEGLWHISVLTVVLFQH